MGAAHGQAPTPPSPRSHNRHRISAADRSVSSASSAANLFHPVVARSAAGWRCLAQQNTARPLPLRQCLPTLPAFGPPPHHAGPPRALSSFDFRHLTFVLRHLPRRCVPSLACPAVAGKPTPCAWQCCLRPEGPAVNSRGRQATVTRRANSRGREFFAGSRSPFRKINHREELPTPFAPFPQPPAS
jgi:hypothetical protein